MRILFQGDSITDMYRKRNSFYDLGEGYPKFVKKLLESEIGFENAEFINRGIGGDRVRSLLNRWQKDCIDLQPDLVSILVGINDTWRRYDGNDPTPVEMFEATYRRILEDVKRNTKAKIIILEPYLIDSDINKRRFRDDLYLKIEAVRRLARELADGYIPLDGLFAQGCVQHEPKFFAEDGIHPSDNGAKLIAKHYAKEVIRIMGHG